MKASEMIKLLQRQIKEHGDLDVVHYDEEFQTDYDIEGINFRNRDFTDALKEVISIF